MTGQLGKYTVISYTRTILMQREGRDEGKGEEEQQRDTFFTREDVNRQLVELVRVPYHLAMMLGVLWQHPVEQSYHYLLLGLPGPAHNHSRERRQFVTITI